jgi:hypothetical protein
MEQGLFSEANCCSAREKLRNILYNPKVHCPVQKSSQVVPILSQINPLTLYCFTVLISYTSLLLPSSLFRSGYLVKYIVTCRGYAWLIIVDSKFDHWIYWIFRLQLHWISTSHTWNPFLKTNPSLFLLSSLSAWFSNFCFSVLYSTAGFCIHSPWL